MFFGLPRKSWQQQVVQFRGACSTFIAVKYTPIKQLLETKMFDN
jgi:hypothetical protein